MRKIILVVCFLCSFYTLPGQVLKSGNYVSEDGMNYRNIEILSNGDIKAGISVGYDLYKKSSNSIYMGVQTVENSGTIRKATYNYYLEIVSDKQIKMYKEGQPKVTLNLKANNAIVTGMTNCNLYDKYMKKMKDDPLNTQVWSLCAAAALQLCNAPSDETRSKLQVYYATSIKGMAPGNSCPCYDVIPNSAWNSVTGNGAANNSGFDQESASPTRNTTSYTNKSIQPGTNKSNQYSSQSSGSIYTENETGRGTVKGEQLFVTKEKNASSNNSANQSQNTEQQRIRLKEEIKRNEAMAQDEQRRQAVLAEQRRLAALQNINRIEQQIQQNRQMEQNLEQSVTGFVSIVGSMIAANQADKQAEKERLELERLRKEEARLKAEEEARIAAEEARRIEFERKEAIRKETERLALLLNYYENTIPQYTRPNAYKDAALTDAYYFYIVRTNENTLNFSKPFLLRKLGDGTWPFVADINNKLKSETSAVNFKLVGFYTDGDVALSNARLLVQSARQSGFNVNEFNFIYKDYKKMEQKPEDQTPSKKTTGSDFWKKY
jgi:hypothetical protein